MSDLTETKRETKPVQILAELHRLLKRLSADQSRPMSEIAEEKLWELFPDDHAAYLRDRQTAAV